MKSLKVNTRAGLNKRIVPVLYKVTDPARIRHLETKHILASVKTKKELTNYLAHKLATDLEKDFMIVFERTC